MAISTGQSDMIWPNSINWNYHLPHDLDSIPLLMKLYIVLPLLAAATLVFMLPLNLIYQETQIFLTCTIVEPGTPYLISVYLGFFPLKNCQSIPFFATFCWVAPRVQVYQVYLKCVSIKKLLNLIISSEYWQSITPLLHFICILSDSSFKSFLKMLFSHFRSLQIFFPPQSY